jgi:hypothetical protein
MRLKSCGRSLAQRLQISCVRSQCRSAFADRDDSPRTGPRQGRRFGGIQQVARTALAHPIGGLIAISNSEVIYPNGWGVSVGHWISAGSARYLSKPRRIQPECAGLGAATIATYTSVQQLILEHDTARMQQIRVYLEDKTTGRDWIFSRNMSPPSRLRNSESCTWQPRRRSRPTWSFAGRWRN